MIRFLFLSLLSIGLYSSSSFAQTEFRLGIEVKDKYTQQPLVPIISVLEINTEVELKGQILNDWYVVNVKPNTQYQVFVALQEYKTYRQTLTFNTNTTPVNNIHPFVIELEPIKPPKTTAIAQTVDKPVTQSVEKHENKPPPISKQALKFIAIDAQTNQPIAAQFKLTDEIKESYTGHSNIDGSSFNPIVVVQSRPYSLTVMADGYQKYESKIDINQNLGQKPIVIKLSKLSIVLKVRIIDGQTSQPLAAHLRILDQTEKRLALDVKNTPNGQAALPLHPSHSYLIEAQAKGFMPYQQTLEKAVPILKEDSELTISMPKIGETYLHLTASDATTGKKIAAIFKITASLTGQTTEIKSAPLPVKFKISEPDIYYLETLAAGYAALKHEIDAEEIRVGQVFEYEAKLTPESSKASLAPIKTFTFKVLDATTQKPILRPRFNIKNTSTQKLIPPRGYASGVQVGLKIDQNYLIEIEANGYEPTRMQLEAADWAKRGEFLTNISLVPLKKNSPSVKIKPVVNEKIFDNIKAGQSLAIEDNVYFDQSSYILRSEAYGQLNRLAAIMKRTPTISIEIVGHTDNTGDPRLNQTLSEQRAKVIANYLGNQGVDESSITHRGEGASKPIAPNDSEENRQRNRRVQFLIK
ncbi:MAG: OmpA family protein [Spirosomataceae bacterium]